MGGGGPRRRPRAEAEEQRPQTGWDTLISLLPILFLFIFPLLSSIFSGAGDLSPKTPTMVFDQASPPLVHRRMTPRLNVDYFIDPNDIVGWNDYKLAQLDKEAETGFVRALGRRCEAEMRTRQDLIDKAYTWWGGTDQEKMKIAEQFEMSSCKRMDALGVSR